MCRIFWDVVIDETELARNADTLMPTSEVDSILALNHMHLRRRAWRRRFAARSALSVLCVTGRLAVVMPAPEIAPVVGTLNLSVFSRPRRSHRQHARKCLA